MLAKLVSLIFHGRAAQPATPAPLKSQQMEFLDDDIPRYPPFAKGIPSVGVDRMMQSQKELLQRIRRILRFNDTEFNSLVLPVIERYANYVHLLPASEAHHHRGAGGLFRHGLEVGAWAAQGSEAYQLCTADSPQNKINNEPRWQLAAFIAGLCHDVGKPLSDVAVMDRVGGKEWNPYESGLAQWTIDEGVSSYYLRWRPNRNRRHEKFSLMNLDQIVTSQAKRYINHPGPEIMKAMLEALVGTGASDPLTKLVLWADSESVAMDLKSQRFNPDEHNYGVPVERFIFDALRRISSSITANVKGSLIWTMEGGIYLNWVPLCARIHQLLMQDKIPGVPKDPDTLADILIERGFAIQCPLVGSGGEVSLARYWYVYPDIMDGFHFVGLRINDVDLIFTSEPPPFVSGATGAPRVAKQTKESESAIANTETDVPGLAEPTIDTEIPHASNITNMADQSLISNTPKTAREIQKSQQSLQQSTVPVEIVSWTQVDEVKQNESAERIDPIAEITQGTRATPGWHLLAKAVRESQTNKEIFEFIGEKSLAIPYPESAALLNADHQAVRNTLNTERLLKRDPLFIGIVTTIGERKYLVLSDEVSSFIKRKLHEMQHGIPTDIPEEERRSVDKQQESARMRFKNNFFTQLKQGQGEFIFNSVHETVSDNSVIYAINVGKEDEIRFSSLFGKPKHSVGQILEDIPEFYATERSIDNEKKIMTYKYKMGINA